MSTNLNIYQVVTQKIIEQLEMGTIPWQKPWFSVSGGAYNALSGHVYSMLNQLLLPHPGEWASYNQWLKVGGQVRQVEKSSIVVFWKWPDSAKDADTDDDDASEITYSKMRRPILKYYHVFHVSQVEGVEPLIPAETANNHIEPIKKAEDLLMHFIAREEIRLETDFGDKACYIPATDTIVLPNKQQFRNAESLYNTAFHECLHASGAEKRLNRKGLRDPKFGTETYSKEELIAELGSASIMHMLGIETEYCFQNSASYIQNWLKILKNDLRCVISASGQAEKAVRYIIGEMPLKDAALAAECR